MKPEDWKTKRICHCKLHPDGIGEARHYDVLSVGYAKNGGPVWPIRTDFETLTQAQRDTLRRETDFWRGKPWVA